MFDWKEFFPVQAIAPFIGGLLVWFGINYVYLSPAVITPRLAQAYYVPSCMVATASMSTGYKARVKAMDEAFEARLVAARQDMMKRMHNAAGQGLGALFGNSAEGQRLTRQGQGLLGSSTVGSYLMMSIEQEVSKARAEYHTQKEQAKNEIRSKQKFSDKQSFCACNVGEGLANRMDTSLYVASLRIYKPDLISRLEQGALMNDACGTPPVES